MPKPADNTNKQDQDRSWVIPPNTIIRQGTKNTPQKLSYWIDKKGKANLYTKDQLAICNVLMELNTLITKSLILLDTLKMIDKDASIGSLLNQDFARFEAKGSSAFNRFINLMAAVPDVTFAEFLIFLSPNTDQKKFIKMGQKTLEKVVKGKNTGVTNFYTSDRFKKS